MTIGKGKYQCPKCNQLFEDFSMVKVIWSGDELPACPHCQTSPWEMEFKYIKD